MARPRRTAAARTAAAGPVGRLGSNARTAPAGGALLRNLVENALRHVPQGGEVQLVIARMAHEATIDVIDDGLGIPVEQRAAVFARFHREKSSRGEGYGLDLSIVQRAAELHNASIELLGSPFGSGLRVRVTIPVIE